MSNFSLDATDQSYISLTFCILETSKGVHWQTVKMQNVLFANINTEVYNNMVLSTFDPLQHIMDNAFFIVFICMEKSTRIQRVNEQAISILILNHIGS